VEPEHKINENIRHPQVRVTGEHPVTGEKMPGLVMPTRQAMSMADELGVDLVMITESADPPVVRLVDYKKYLYDQKRRKKEMESNATKTEVKELRLGPNTDEHDIEFKARHAANWLSSGDKVKVVMQFKGRNIVHKDRGELLMLKMAEKLMEHGSPEGMPQMEGKKMFMYFKPKKK
jgi:translation initiation factor IF-3